MAAGRRCVRRERRSRSASRGLSSAGIRRAVSSSPLRFQVGTPSPSARTTPLSEAMAARSSPAVAPKRASGNTAPRKRASSSSRSVRMLSVVAPGSSGSGTARLRVGRPVGTAGAFVLPRTSSPSRSPNAPASRPSKRTGSAASSAAKRRGRDSSCWAGVTPTAIGPAPLTGPRVRVPIATDPNDRQSPCRLERSPVGPVDLE